MKQTVSAGLRLLLIAFLFACALWASPAVAQTSGDPGADVSEDPEEAIFARPPGPATVVTVQLEVEDIITVNERETLVEIDASLEAFWIDKRQAFECEGAEPRRRVYSGEAALEKFTSGLWQPEFHIREGRGPRTATELAVLVSCQGVVTYEERFVATLDLEFDGLNHFPFDAHTIKITVEPFGIGGTGRVLFERPEKVDRIDGDYDLFGAGNWESEEWRFSATKSQQTVDPLGPTLETLIEIDRKSTFYVVNIVLPLILIVGLSWAVFWMSPTALAERMGVSTTSLLTVVAFDFLTQDNLPKLAYTTRLDAFYNISYLFVALTVVTSLIVLAQSRGTLPRWLAGADNRRFATLDHRAELIFPCAYLAMVAFAMAGLFSPGAGGYGSWISGDEPVEDFFEASSDDFRASPDASESDAGDSDQPSNDFVDTFGFEVVDDRVREIDLSDGFEQTGRIESTTSDAYRFCIEGDEPISIAMNRQNPEEDTLDPLLALYSDAGQFIRFADDRGLSLDAAMVVEPSAGNCYLVVATDVTGTGVGDYVLTRAEDLGEEDLEPTDGITLEQVFATFDAAFGSPLDDVPAEDVALSSGLVLTRRIDAAADFQIFRFCAIESELIVLEMASLTEDEFLDPLLVLYDSGGALVSLDDDGGGDLDSRLTLEAPAEGRYFAVATDASRSETGTYRLTGRVGGC